MRIRLMSAHATLVALAVLTAVVATTSALAVAPSSALAKPQTQPHELSSSGPSALTALSFRAELHTRSLTAACPPNAPAGADCRARTGAGDVSGLGRTTASYTWFFDTGPCPVELVKPLATTAQLVVAGKGTIQLALADGARCVDVEPVRNEPQAFSITGGTGRYQGATGSGAVERSLSAGAGVEFWTGTLTVAGLEFDTVPPTIVGAVARTVRAPAGAKRVRVTFKVTANDAVEGVVGASCAPRSGTFFRLGRTVVTCAAADTSGNTRTARFVVTLRR